MNDMLDISGKLSPMQKAEKLVKLANLKKEVETAYNQLRDDLLAVTQQLDVLTLKTGSYTISRACRVTPSVDDIPTLKKSLESAGIEYKMKEVFADYMTDVFKQAIKEGKELEGLSAKTTEYVSVRVNKETK